MRSGCVAMLLDDEANMHALDLAKVHLDRIALHYMVLQWVLHLGAELTG